jgi:hypothetical protein
MSFYDKKSLVILTVLYKLVEVYYTGNDKDLLLHRIQLLIGEYKIGLRKAEHTWIKYYTILIGNKIADTEFEVSDPLVLSIVFMVAENYRMILKNPRRIVAWESVENFLAKKTELNSIEFNDQYDKAEKICSLLIDDYLYL